MLGKTRLSLLWFVAAALDRESHLKLGDRRGLRRDRRLLFGLLSSGAGPFLPMLAILGAIPAVSFRLLVGHLLLRKRDLK